MAVRGDRETGEALPGQTLPIVSRGSSAAEQSPTGTGPGFESRSRTRAVARLEDVVTSTAITARRCTEAGPCRHRADAACAADLP